MLPRRSDFVLGVDLDGVCADFYSAARPLAAKWLDVDLGTLTPNPAYGLEEWGLDRNGGYTEFHKHLLELAFFRDIPMIAGANESLQRISDMGVRIRIITHRLFISSRHQASVLQTVEWLDARRIPYRDLCFMADKHEVGADLYIEDAPKNIAALRAQRAPTIIFTNSTNLDVPGARADTWHEVERLVADEVARARNLYATEKFSG